MSDAAEARVAQRKRGGPITHRSQDRNLALIKSGFRSAISDYLSVEKTNQSLSLSLLRQIGQVISHHYQVRAIISSKEEIKETSSVKKQKIPEVRSPGTISTSSKIIPLEVPSPVAKVFPTVSPIAPSSLSNQENVERSIALFFFENKLDFSVARSSSYQAMIDAVGKYGPGFTGPSAETLKTTWLDRIKSERSRLKHMFNSPEYSTNSSYANKPQSISCIAIVEDNDFWRAVEECVAISEPFLKVLREVSGGKPAVGSIYELMTRAKESIRTYYIMDEGKCKTFLDIVDRKWRDQLHSPLHSAGAFLNPSIQYNQEIKFLGSIKEDFFKVLEKLLPTPELRRDITNQIFTFTRAKGMFACNLAVEARDTVSPGCAC
ncbi:hypothetical protein CCACVL1_28770 [Corchorus capsularis]|uniref:Uncharacterized protein n=1 Tax=Corchorus capsularis TaxID=210143 RepID=A0A1R3G5G8_COCAP|nr:hypothetical protein CCACVL1_28770 [Corchorus capsularis]